MTFKDEHGDWTEYRKLQNVREIDFHRANGSRHDYSESMAQVASDALAEIKSAHESGQIGYVLFTHGRSTSRPGWTTARSQVRGVMRSKDATPFIDRKRCIQHDSAFLAAIRPK